MIHIECPACQVRLRTSEKKRGHRLKCPACHELVLVPAQGSEVTASPTETRRARSIDDTQSERIRQPGSEMMTVPAPTAVPARPTERERRTPFEASSSELTRTDNSTGIDNSTDESPPAPRLSRALGFVIDALLTVVVAPLILVPLIGNVLIGVLLVVYWLLRDLTGASLGKYLLGYEVVSVRGRNDRTRMHRILRNIPLALGPLAFAVPIAGFLLGLIVAPLALAIEVVMVLATGRRVGDLLAGTTVRKQLCREND